MYIKYTCDSERYIEDSRPARGHRMWGITQTGVLWFCCFCSCFSFSFLQPYISKTGWWNLQKDENTNVYKQKQFQENAALSRQRTRKGEPRKRKSGDTNFLTQAKYPRKIWCPNPPLSTKAKLGISISDPARLEWASSNPLLRGCHKRPSEKLRPPVLLCGNDTLFLMVPEGTYRTVRTVTTKGPTRPSPLESKNMCRAVMRHLSLPARTLSAETPCGNWHFTPLWW